MGTERFVKPKYMVVAAALLGAVTLAHPLHAQGRITAGQTVYGRLDTTDPKRESDDTYYDDWYYDGRSGERIVVTQSSSDFDSWLLIGRLVNGTFQLDEFDDDGAGGNDARIAYALPEDGRYVIRVNVVGRGRTGAYSLRLERQGGGSGPARTGGRMLSAGQSFEGELDSSDPLWTDDTHYELWRYAGRAGERLTIIMRSPSFNSYLQFGKMVNGEFEYVKGSSSRTIGGQQETVLEVTLSETGEYGVRANSHGRRTGSYVLTVSSSGAGGGSSGPGTRSSASISPGTTIHRDLAVSDVQTDSGWYHDDYTFEGSRGDLIYVEMISSDFDPYLDVYRGSTRVVSDDDGGDGLNARVAYVLTESGTYTICARSRYANRTGAYTLSLRSAK